MTSDVITTFVEQRPLEPFSFRLVDGRELFVPHFGFVTLGFAAQSFSIMLPTKQLEVIDAGHVVSIRTFYRSELPRT